jgi:hypothetical protein
MESSDDSKKSFFKYVFNFDNDTKSELLNVMQFAILSIIPVVLLNKGISKYIPEVDEKKSSLEIVAEILIQIVVMCLGLFIINRIITYVPTYSGEKYPEHSLIYAIMPVLMVILSLQTRLGEKVSVLSDRVVELWEGKPSNTKQRSKPNSNQSNVKITQPLSTRGAITSQTSNAAAMQQAMYTDGTSINTLPTNDMSNGGSQNTLAPQQLPNYNNMYEKDDTPLVNAATPGGGQEGFNEPMAANSVLGGGFGSSW